MAFPIIPLITGLIRGVVGRAAGGAALRGGAGAAAGTGAKKGAEQFGLGIKALPGNLKELFGRVKAGVTSEGTTGARPVPRGTKPDLGDRLSELFGRRKPAPQSVGAGAERRNPFGRLLDTLRGNRGRQAQPTPDTERRKGAATKPKLSMTALMGISGLPREERGRAKQVVESHLASQEQQAEQAEKKVQREARLAQAGKRFIKTLVSGAIAIPLFVLSLRKWSNALVASRRELVIYNGRIAQAVANLDVRKFHLGVSMSRKTETSTVKLLEAVGDFRQAFHPIEVDLRNLMNFIAIWLIKKGTEVSKIAILLKAAFILLKAKLQGKEAEALGEILELLKGLMPNKNEAWDFLNSLQTWKGANRPGPRKPLPPVI